MVSSWKINDYCNGKCETVRQAVLKTVVILWVSHGVKSIMHTVTSETSTRVTTKSEPNTAKPTMHAFTPKSQQAEAWHRKRPQDWPLACCSECSASYLCHSAATEGLKGSANQQTNRGGGVQERERESEEGQSSETLVLIKKKLQRKKNG